MGTEKITRFAKGYVDKRLKYFWEDEARKSYVKEREKSRTLKTNSKTITIVKPDGSTEEIVSNFLITEKQVDFPFGLFIIFLVIDIIDIFSIFTGFIWNIFSFLIIFPFQLWYVQKRDEKYSSYQLQKSIDLAALKRLQNSSKELRNLGSRLKNLEASIDKLNKAGKTAQAAKAAANTAKIFPWWLRILIGFADKLPIIGILPGNTILLLLSYYDNKASVRAIKSGLILLSKSNHSKVVRGVANK